MLHQAATSRSTAEWNADETLTVVVEMSLSSWLIAGLLPGVERRPLKKLAPDEVALMALIERWRQEAIKVSTAATNQSRWRRKSRPSQRIFLSEDRFFVRPARTASSSRPAVSTAVARGGGQGGPKGTA